MKFPIFLFLLIIGSGLVFAVPELPMIISGDVYINDKPAKIGTEVTAKIGDQEVANIEISEKGSYTFLLQKLDEGIVVKLYVDDIDSEESVEYKGGDFKQLTLKVEKSYLVYYAVGAIVLLAAGFVIWKRKLILKRKKK